MKINTRYHGEVEINQEDILSFAKGIPGFQEEREFCLLPLSEEGVYYVMQSLNTSELAFIVTNPFNFFKEYDFTLEESVIEELHLESEKDVRVYTILTVQDPFIKTTANLQAPVITNLNNRKAKQVVLHNEQYGTKQPIFQNDEVKG
ncbi:flagellar assembly protein FliW [Mesobacillus subterraneus]|uniref:Flagellar assembly factor FliW n=1 Tax=Mesobacillus subterraneus TaxID=285983 RepID=A0A427TLH5_9BACI|nr:flagellar assembly protein FliW [Mesobacillus subterraneus]RSD25200.1 flagellar assembly protein FliW [Mesobacillus subterraneus]